MSPSADNMNGAPISTSSSGILPGTTFPEKSDSPPSKESTPPTSYPGPRINDRATTVTLYEPIQLRPDLPIMPSLVRTINKAFRHSHANHGVFPNEVDRLQSQDQYHQNLGYDPGTFVYIITWTDEPHGVVGTAGAHRYVAPVIEVGREEERSIFSRVQLPERIKPDSDLWELKLMAVDTGLQGKGIASYLMNLVDEEVKARFLAEEKGSGRELWMLLTTLKEINEKFYERRGYEFDYETHHPPRYMGSETGFHVVHMSKRLDT